jgi:hypothetical protein
LLLDAESLIHGHFKDSIVAIPTAHQTIKYPEVALRMPLICFTVPEWLVASRSINHRHTRKGASGSAFVRMPSGCSLRGAFMPAPRLRPASAPPPALQGQRLLSLPVACRQTYARGYVRCKRHQNKPPSPPAHPEKSLWECLRECQREQPLMPRPTTPLSHEKPHG